MIADYWMHNGRIDLQGEKMSKSLGNVIWAEKLVDEIGYGPYRLMILNVPYRQPMNFRQEVLDQAKTDYEKLIKAKMSLVRKLQIEKGIIKYNKEIENEDIKALENEFKEAMSNDFNTANAITALQKVMKNINMITRSKELDEKYAMEILSLLDKEMWVLGIDKEIEPLNEKDLEVVLNWKKAREDKNFELADKYRNQMNEQGITL